MEVVGLGKFPTAQNWPLLLKHVPLPHTVQAIRSRGQQPRPYVYFPLPLAAAIGLEPGEEVQWELLERGELNLVRAQVPRPQAKARRRATA
jgi:hypothetical protein